MNRIEELQIKLEKARSNAQKLDNQIATIQEEINELKKEQEETMGFQRQKASSNFYIIMFFDGKAVVSPYKDTCDTHCDGLFKNNNYFLTKERAQEVADKINFLLRLERLHDELCSNYTPDWNNCNLYKYFIMYDGQQNKFTTSYRTFGVNQNDVYFPTEEIVRKVCDILNSGK